jgi:endogenous inhibitor of DNA gyrase (YacG/DUF329 family)
LNKILKEVRSRELICPICAIHFTTHHVTKKFCSNKCYLKDRQRRIGEWLKKDKIKKRIYKTIVCPICSIEFTTHNKGVKFCSKACLLIRTKILRSKYRQKPENKKKSADRVKKLFKENYKHPEFRKKISDLQRANRKKDPEKTKVKDKELYWKRKNNPEIHKRDKEYKNNWLKNKKKEDPYYKIRASLSASLFQFLKREGTIKFGSISRLIGVSKEELKKHLESKWYPHPKTGEFMSWSNYGLKGWHVDHIMPFESFKKYDVTKEETQKKIMELSNLRPMWGDENRSKSNKY